MLARGVRLATLVAVASACGGDDECVTGVADDGSWTIAANPALVCLRGVTARARIDGAWSDSVDVQVTEVAGGAIVVMQASGEVEAYELRLPDVAGDRILQQGYQSWSFSGAIKLPAEVPLHEDGAPAFSAAATGDIFDAASGVSYGSAVLGAADGPYLVVGAVSAGRASTGIAAAEAGEGRAQVSIVYGAARESLGAGTASEPIALLGAAAPGEGLARLAGHIADALPADTPAPQRPPGGWYSWNERFVDVDQDYVRAHIGLVRDTLAPVGLPLVEIDDGWMIAWGDWRDNARFADGLEVLAGEIEDAGLVAGVWMAPFLVDVGSEPAATLAPSLFVRDENGEPIVHSPFGLPDFYVLDGSNPDSLAVATDAVERLSTAGYRFFKFDYLYAGALPGTRANDVTGVEALREGMRLLRAAAGPDAIINACGSPILPVIGLTDSLRIGPDTAFGGVTLSLPMFSSAARSYAARSYLAPLVWLDADQAQLRAPYTDDQARVTAAVAALAGPAYSLGDDLGELDAERLGFAIDATLLDIAAASVPATPIDLMATPAPEAISTPLLEAFRDPTYTEAPPPTEFEVTGASGARYRLAFAWDPPQTIVVEPVE